MARGKGKFAVAPGFIQRLPSMLHPTFKLKSWPVLAIAFIIFVPTNVFNIYQLIFESNFTLFKINRLILVDCLGFSAVALLVNSWSIIEIKRYRASFQHEEQKCPYCSAENAGPLLCKGCNSIMWDWIRSRYTQTAVFIAQHRWSVLTGFMALFVIAPLSMLFTLRNETQKRIDGLIQRIDTHVKEQNALRSLVRAYESNNQDTAIREDKLEEIKKLYLQNSWDYPELIKEIKKYADADFSKASFSDTTAFGVAKYVEAAVIDGTEDQALGVKSSAPRWDQFIEAVYKAAAGKTSTTDRKQAAFNLFAETKVQNLVLREYALQLQHLKLDDDENNKALLGIFGDGKTLQQDTLKKIIQGSYRMDSIDKLLFQI